jgi:hypothetical protein
MNYVEHLWQEQLVADRRKKNFSRFTAWAIGIAISLALAGYLTQEYWYPYVSPYLQR